MKVLVVNCGSSSTKYTLFEMESEKKIAWGIVECIGLSEAYYKRQTSGAKEKKTSNMNLYISQVFEWLESEVPTHGNHSTGILNLKLQFTM